MKSYKAEELFEKMDVFCRNWPSWRQGSPADGANPHTNGACAARPAHAGLRVHAVNVTSPAPSMTHDTQVLGKFLR